MTKSIVTPGIVTLMSKMINFLVIKITNVCFLSKNWNTWMGYKKRVTKNCSSLTTFQQIRLDVKLCVNLLLFFVKMSFRFTLVFLLLAMYQQSANCFIVDEIGKFQHYFSINFIYLICNLIMMILKIFGPIQMKRIHSNRNQKSISSKQKYRSRKATWMQHFCLKSKINSTLLMMHCQSLDKSGLIVSNQAVKTTQKKDVLIASISLR